MREVSNRALDRLSAETTAVRRRLFRYARDEPSPIDVAIHPESGRYHNPAHVEGADVGYVTEDVASTILEECPHCPPQGRRTVIHGPGGGQ